MADAGSSNSNGDREERVHAIVAAHLQAADSGRPSDWRDLLKVHPDLASELEEFFTGHDLADAWVGPVPAMSSDTLSKPPASANTLVVARAAPEPSAGSFGDYELLEIIAQGGMGIVWKARQKSLSRLVALKSILAGSNATADDLQRFRVEAEAAARLDHPNIVPIYEVGQHGSRHFFSMKLIEGGTLSDRMRAEGGKMKAEESIRILALVARAIHFAHRRGVLHRDLKPGNILLEWRTPAGTVGQPGPSTACVPYVADFGLARRLEADSNLTQTGAIVGTPSYMAPEQAAGKKNLGPAVDIYGLGAILYHLLTGRRPFEADTPMATLLAVQVREPERPSGINRHIPRDLETICLKCLEKNPRNRYESAYGLAEDCERWLAGEAIRARPATRLERLVRWTLKHPAFAGLTYLVLLFAVFLVALLGFTSSLRLEVKRLQHDLDRVLPLVPPEKRMPQDP